MAKNILGEIAKARGELAKALDERTRRRGESCHIVRFAFADGTRSPDCGCDSRVIMRFEGRGGKDR